VGREGRLREGFGGREGAGRSSQTLRKCPQASGTELDFDQNRRRPDRGAIYGGDKKNHTSSIEIG